MKRDLLHFTFVPLLTRNDEKFPTMPTGINIGKHVLSRTSIAKIKRNISSFSPEIDFV